MTFLSYFAEAYIVCGFMFVCLTDMEFEQNPTRFERIFWTSYAVLFWYFEMERMIDRYRDGK